MGYDKLYWYYRDTGEQIIHSADKKELLNLFMLDFNNGNLYIPVIFYTGGGGCSKWEEQISMIKGENLFKLMYEAIRDDKKKAMKE